MEEKQKQVINYKLFAQYLIQVIGLIEINDGQIPLNEFSKLKKNEFIKESQSEVLINKNLKGDLIRLKNIENKQKSFYKSLKN